MRGCLFVLALAALVLSIGAWFGSPVLAASLISTALGNAGYHAATSTVTATSDPPPKLLLGRADRVEIRGTGVDFRTFHAATRDLVLTDVDVVGRTAGHLTGSIRGAELVTTSDEPTTADIAVDGPADRATATIVVSGETVSRVVTGAVSHGFGVTARGVRLEAPDVLRLDVGGATIQGHLSVDPAGAIALATPLGSTTLLRLDPSFPLRLRSIEVVDGGLRIDATLDATALLGG